MYEFLGPSPTKESQVSVTNYKRAIVNGKAKMVKVEDVGLVQPVKSTTKVQRSTKKPLVLKKKCRNEVNVTGKTRCLNNSKTMRLRKGRRIRVAIGGHGRGKPPFQPSRNHSVVRQPNAFKSERPRISKLRFASQVDVKHNLLKPVTPYYFPNFRESAPAKPQHVNAHSSSRKGQKESWKPTGRIFKTVGLRWVPTGKIFTDSTTKVDSEPPNGSNDDITNPYECDQTLNVSAGTLNLGAGTYFNPKKERLGVWLLNRVISQKPRVQGSKM
nr:hypothetical protein [Tanacetum cinerariifolium]